MCTCTDTENSNEEETSEGDVNVEYIDMYDVLQSASTESHTESETPETDRDSLDVDEDE